jgi:hypothetical protein
MSESVPVDDTKTVGVWQPVLFGAMAGGMAWGIRGQYGHETGAMIAGLLVGLTLTFLLCPRAPSFQWNTRVDRRAGGRDPVRPVGPP